MKVELANLKEDISSSFKIENDLSKLSEIFEKDKNISILKRKLDTSILDAAKYILKEKSQLHFSKIAHPQDIEKKLNNIFGSNIKTSPLFRDIARVVDIFCSLFSVKNVWLRLDAIEGPMCPRFHVDNLKCRLVSTYLGPGTEWLPNHLVNRHKLGHGNNGELDEKSGLFSENANIEQLDIGDLGLLKGENWDRNQGNGLVHRSPQKDSDYKRLYMTIDFVDLYLRINRNPLNRLFLD